MTQAPFGYARLHAMKYLPSTLLIGALALALQAQTPQTKPTADTKPPGDPFVKNAGDTAVNANEEANQSPPNCLVVFEAYSMNKDEAAALLAIEGGSVARYRRVLDLAKAGTARLQTLTALSTKSGQRAVTESVDEVRYATDFAPPATAKDLPTPTGWNARNAGDTFEVEPVLSPDHTLCDLNLVPTRVTLAGFRDEAGMVEDAPMAQPVFHTQKITTSVCVTVGEPYYLGTFTPPRVQVAGRDAVAGEMWLSFLHVYLQQLPAVDPKTALKPDEAGIATLDYSCYSLDRTAARELLSGASPITAPWEKLQALVGEKKAGLEFVSSIRTKSGQRMVTEEIQEVRFTSSYVPASLARWQDFAQTTDPAGNISNTTNFRIPSNHERIPGYGKAFETRNAGITVEVEPVIAPNGNVDVTQAIQNVNFPGMLKVTGVAARYQPQPLFQSSKVTTSVTVMPGKHTLVGTLNPPGADGVNDRADTGRTWLLFVSAAIRDR